MKTNTRIEDVEEVHWKNKLNRLLKAVQANEVGCFADVEYFVDHLITTERERGAREALKNVPVGFVRQWINEDLLKDGHRLVTNEDIQGFIDIALTTNHTNK